MIKHPSGSLNIIAIDTDRHSGAKQRVAALLAAQSLRSWRCEPCILMCDLVRAGAQDCELSVPAHD